MPAREMLEFVLPWLVDDPDAIKIEEGDAEGGGVLYEITVGAEDVGKVIGRRGRIVRSLRQLARAAGTPDGDPVSVEVLD